MFTLDKAIKYSALPLIIGIIIGGLLLYFFYQSIDPNEEFDKIALGAENTFVLDSSSNDKIHCEGGLTNIQDCLNTYSNVGKNKNIVVWLGNSQLHSINQYKPGDQLASFSLHQKLANFNKYLMTFSHPNVNLQEHLILFEYLSQNVAISELILPVVFDDMRETGIRPGLEKILSINFIQSELEKTDIGNKILMRQNNIESINTGKGALNETLQEAVEEYLNSLLGSIY